MYRMWHSMVENVELPYEGSEALTAMEFNVM